MDAFQPFASSTAFVRIPMLDDETSEPKPKRRKVHQKGSRCSKKPSTKKDKPKVQSGQGAKKEKPSIKSTRLFGRRFSSQGSSRNGLTFGNAHITFAFDCLLIQYARTENYK